MPNKVFVLDTNVFLHDPEAILKFQNSNIVIPLVVLEELDKLKRFSDELGKNARQVIRFIEGLGGTIFKGALLENGSFLSIFIDDKKKEGKGFPLSLEPKKHRILFAAYRLKQQGYEVVIMISKDFILRIKAESIGIEAQDYENLKESLDTLYSGYRKLEVEKRQIDELMTRGHLELSQEQFLPNEFCRFTSKEESTVLGKYNGKKGRMERLSSQKEEIWGVHPLNDKQRCAMNLLLSDEIKLVTLVGQAGTGKTLIALTAGLRKVFDEGVYGRILVSRPIMPLGKDIGYLPGTKEEKIYHWMQPIYDNLEFICESISGIEKTPETKQWIMESEKIEMEAVTFIRGRSFANTYIIIDEAQNLTPHEIKAIISRAGKGTKVILTGDPTQIDNPYLNKNSNGLTYVIEKFKSHAIYGHMLFSKTERSELAALAAKIL